MRRSGDAMRRHSAGCDLAAGVPATDRGARSARSILYSAVVSVADDERRLVRAAAAGDEDAFAILMRRHEGRVRATCLRIVGNPTAADDCVQEAFAQAWRALGRFDGRSLFGTWLYRIAANAALQALRRRRPGEVLVDELPAGLASKVPGPDIDRVDRERVRAIVRLRLLELPETLRVPVVLRDVEEWSNDEIADALGVTLAAAKARIHRGRLQLRVLLAGDFPDR